MRIHTAITLLLFLPTLLWAEQWSHEVLAEDVDLTTIMGEPVYKFELVLPDGIDGDDVISAVLEVRSKTDSECETSHYEIQVAAYEDNSIILPSGKPRPPSEVSDSETYESLWIDVDSIIEDALEASKESVCVVLGSLSSDAYGCWDVIELDDEAGVWAQFKLYY